MTTHLVLLPKQFTEVGSDLHFLEMMLVSDGSELYSVIAHVKKNMFFLGRTLWETTSKPLVLIVKVNM